MNKEDFEKAFATNVAPTNTKEIQQKLEEATPVAKVGVTDIISNKISSPAENPLLQKLHRIPGETFRLPTRGVFYKNGEIDESVVNGEVVVYPMTGHEELIMKSPDMVFQGTAIDRVIKRCVPGVLKPLDMSSNDIEFLLACIRKVTHGEFIKVFYKCDDDSLETPMDQRVEREYDISLLSFIGSVKEISKDDFGNLAFVLGDIFDVTIKPVTMRSLIEVKQNLIPKFDDVLEATHATQLKIFSAMIASVDGITDEDMILGWLEALPVALRDELLEKIQVLHNWGIAFDCKFVCKDCNKVVNKPTAINPINFFLTPYGQTIQ
jgi:hypothetical protein